MWRNLHRDVMRSPHLRWPEKMETLLFAGPFCELATGLLAGRMPRRLVWTLVWMLPVFAVSILVCTKAWIDGLLGRPCCWVKTQRSASGLVLDRASP